MDIQIQDYNTQHSLLSLSPFFSCSSGVSLVKHRERPSASAGTGRHRLGQHLTGMGQTTRARAIINSRASIPDYLTSGITVF